MKKFKDFLHRLPTKIYLVLAAIVLFSFFSNDFGLVDIQKTAVILAAAVDRTEEGFSLTAQIAVPKGTERSSCGTGSIDIVGEGKTVADCVAQIYSKTGWVPKLIFCNLVLLGENTAKEDVFDALDFFLRNEYMPDNCFIAVCEGTAHDMITTKSAIDDTTSQSMGKLFSDANGKSGKVMKTTLKEFAIGYHGVSKSGYMPFIRKIEQDCGSGSGGGAGTESSGSGGGQSSGGSSEGADQKHIFAATETAIFSDGKMAALLNKNQTFAFSLLKSKVFAGTFTVEEDGKPVTLTVLSDKGGVSLETKNMPKAVLKVDLFVRIHNRGVPSPIEDVAEDSISAEAEQSATRLISGYLRELWDTCKQAECDLFNLNRMLYRTSLKEYGKWKDNLLRTVEPEINAKVKSTK